MDWFNTGVDRNKGFKGINSEAIPDAAEAIRIYVSDANEYLNILQREDDVSEAFRGDYAIAVNRFVNSVIEAVKEPLRELESFESAIKNAAREYEQKDAEVRSSVGRYEG